MMTNLLTDLENMEIKDKKFRFQNQKAMFTYKTHIDKVAWDTWVKGKIPRTRRVYIAHENGEGDEITPYEHTHIVVDFGEVFQTQNVRYFDWEGIHPHISKIKTSVQWKKACKYICKEDTTVTLVEDDEWSIANDIWRHDSVQAALEKCTSLRDVMPTIALFQQKEVSWGNEINCSIKSLEDMYPWQRQIYDFCYTKPNDRTVYWIYDEGGCQGKTQLIKYMTINDENKVMWIVPSGSTRDIIHMVMEQIKMGWRGDTVMINLSRSATSSSDMGHVYRVIEDLKDGMIYSSKYMGGKMLIPSPHVIVMSNKLPEEHRLSGDRWKVGLIDDEKRLSPCNIKRGESTL